MSFVYLSLSLFNSTRKLVLLLIPAVAVYHVAST